MEAPAIACLPEPLRNVGRACFLTDLSGASLNGTPDSLGGLLVASDLTFEQDTDLHHSVVVAKALRNTLECPPR